MPSNSLARNLLKVTGRHGLCLFLLLSAVSAASAQTVVEGVVYDDANGNANYDDGERGLGGIPVSNGDTVVLTRADGSYRLTVGEGMSVFPILPADRTLSGGRVANSSFYYAEYTEPTGKKRKKPARLTVRFGLTPKAASDDFTLNAIGDIQVGNTQEVDYLSRTLWPELMAGDGKAVNLFLGDLVNNNLSLYGCLCDMMQALPQQSWTLPGNHDRDVDSVITRQNRTYNHYFGADCYAFNEGKVHFVVLNNVYGKGSRGYEGRVSDRQLRFVARDLSLVPADRLVVLCMHVPLMYTKNKDDLIRLLAGHDKAIALSGHLHQVARFFPEAGGRVVPELGAGAACGFWWVGEKDWEGVPSALQQCGTPRNYFQIGFHGDGYSFRCKAIGADAGREMSIHVTGIDSLDAHLRDFKDVAPGMAIITVYGGCDSTQVECRIDGGVWQPCAKADIVEPNVARTREMNLIDAYPTTYNRMNPMRRRPSHQVWQTALPESARTGTHSIEVRASDTYGLRASGRRVYTL